MPLDKWWLVSGGSVARRDGCAGRSDGATKPGFGCLVKRRASRMNLILTKLPLCVAISAVPSNENKAYV